MTPPLSALVSTGLLAALLVAPDTAHAQDRLKNLIQHPERIHAGYEKATP